MPNSRPLNARPSLEDIRTDVALLKQAINNLERSLRTEFEGKHYENRNDIKELKMALQTVAKSVNQVELKIAKYAGGAGVLTAIAIKLIDKIKI